MGVNKEFILTVADFELYETGDNGSLILSGETLIDSTITQSVNTQEVRGGEFSQLLIEYSLEKNLTAVLNDAIFQDQFLAFNNGSEFVNGNFNVYTREASVQLASNIGTLSADPVGNVHVRMRNGEILTVTPSGRQITVAGGGNLTVDARYRTARNVDRLQVGAGTFPSTYRLVLRTKIFTSEDGQGSPIGFFIVEIPNWKVMGGYELTFDTGSPVVSNLEGKALAYKDETSGETIYANYFVDKSEATLQEELVNIFATPDTASIDLSDSQTLQIEVIGIRGNGKTNLISLSGTTYASSDTGIATVDADGLVTPAGTGDAVITVTNGSHEDTVTVTVVA